MTPLKILTALSMILLIGMFCALIGRKLRLSPVLLLVLAGIGLKKFSVVGASLLQFPEIFLTSMGLLALIIIIFDSTSKLKLKEFDQLSFGALKLTLLILGLCVVAVTAAVRMLFGTSWGVALIFSSLIIGTAPDVALILVEKTKSKVIEFLKVESIVNTPLIVLLPFMIIDFLESVESKILLERFIEQIQPFFLQLVAGLGSGLFIGLIVFKLMRKAYSEKLSPLAIIVAALLAYVLAENLGGNGVLSVTTLGVLFGAVAIKEKHMLQEFSGMLTNALEVLVFVLVGMMIDIPLTSDFIIASLLLFALYVLIRFCALYLLFGGAGLEKGAPAKQYLFMALNCPKGIATATVVFLLAASPVPGVSQILDIVLAFLLYSILLSTIVTHFAHLFLVRNVQ